MTLLPAAERALAAFGGEDRWRAGTAVEATVTTGGLAFVAKWRRPYRDLTVRAEIAQPRLRLSPIDRHGNVGVLDGTRVRIEDADGAALALRDDPRGAFPYGRRALWWDGLDQAYFAGYAFWNYLTLPALLLRDDIDWREVDEHTLEARFPPHLPTHCAVQRFHFDPSSGLLRQHDYTAEAFGGWARAAHVVLDHAEWEGIPYAAKRRVTPRGPAGRPLPFPVLVWIDVHAWRLV